MSGMGGGDEFARFGPWIDRVRIVEELPWLYRGSGLDPAAFRLVLKVPRDIERRNATPAMHLYDYVLAVDERTFVVLFRREDRYEAVSVPLDRIVAIENSTRLLDGLLTVHLADGAVVRVRYNGSGSELIQELVDVLRRWYLPEAPYPAPEAPPVALDLGRQEAGLVTDYDRTVAREPGMRLLNVGGRAVVTPASPLEKLFRVIRPLTLLASIVVTDDRELQVIHHRDWFTPGGDDLSLARTIIARERIDAVYTTRHERYAGVHVVNVEAGASLFRFPAAASQVTDTMLVRA